MTFVTAGVMVGGAALSANSAKQANKTAKKSAEGQRQLLERDLNERMRVQKRMEGLYGPIEEQLASQAKAPGIDPFRMGILRSNIEREYGNAGRNINTMIGTRGVSSGLAASMLQTNELSRARAMAAGVLGEYQNKDQLRMGLLSRFNPIQTADYTSQGLRGLASFYGDEAQRARQASQDGWNAAGNGLMNAAMYYSSRPAAPAPSAPTLPKAGLGAGILPSAPGPVPTPNPNTFTATDAYRSFLQSGGLMPTAGSWGLPKGVM
jgi:hypothetical protein